MILTPTTKKLATDFVEKKLAAAARNRILYSTVKLYAKGYKPPDADRALGDFQGSGVIVNINAAQNKKLVTILTAMHNVMSWSKTDDVPGNNLIAQFAAATTIKWVKSNAAFNSEPTGTTTKKPVVAAQVAGLCGDRSNCFYDLLVLECDDKDLYDFAYENVFARQDNTLGAEAKAIWDYRNSILDQKENFYVQLGYGVTKEERTKVEYDKTTKKLIEPTDNKKVIKANSTVSMGDMTDHRLQYRLTAPKFAQFKSAYDQTADPEKTTTPAFMEYAEAIIHTGKPSTTSAPGDSGGPIYAIYKEDLSPYLLGVTSGADMGSAQIPPCLVFRNCVSTSVIPYMQTKKT